jgi:hypothetical protein
MPTVETTQSSVSSKETWRPKVNPWLIAVLVAMAAFMEVLDTSIANVALPHIAGNLGASNDESTWILTSYLVSNAIVLPITGWFAGIFGRKRFFMICLAIFTLSKTRVLGGWLAGELLQPLVDLDVRLPDGASSRVRAVADLTFGGGLQWAPKRVGQGVLAQRVVFDVTVPTGSYSDRQSINIGNHFIALDPRYAVTYVRKQIEFSARLHYLWNSINDDPPVQFNLRDTQAGQAVHLNFATSYEIRKKVRVGFNGYWLQQTTDHRTNDIAVPNSAERVVGLGPGVQLGGPEAWFHLNAYVETAVQNRPKGVKVTLRVSRLWPSKA